MDPSGDIERKQIFNYSSDFFLRRVDRSLSTYLLLSCMHTQRIHELIFESSSWREEHYLRTLPLVYTIVTTVDLLVPFFPENLQSLCRFSGKESADWRRAYEKSKFAIRASQKLIV